eukprot:NODE_42_length_29671_cov_0.584810.p10 type:complete len:207 gc:universal NODE_42_length_29671_cov_0.584810:12668-13288(+)
MTVYLLALLYGQLPPPPSPEIKAQQENDPFLKAVHFIDTIVFGKNARSDPLDIASSFKSNPATNPKKSSSSSITHTPPNAVEPPTGVPQSKAPAPPMPPHGVMPPPLGQLPEPGAMNQSHIPPPSNSSNHSEDAGPLSMLGNLFTAIIAPLPPSEFAFNETSNSTNKVAAASSKFSKMSSSCKTGTNMFAFLCLTLLQGFISQEFY